MSEYEIREAVRMGLVLNIFVLCKEISSGPVIIHAKQRSGRIQTDVNRGVSSYGKQGMRHVRNIHERGKLRRSQMDMH